MDLKSFHDEAISCTLCENRRGINSTCCCPEDAKDLVLIPEEKLRRRIGLEAHQKLCSTHASKLKNGLLFGGSSVFECCAPFHVNTARSPGLRSVPHSWKEYFPTPNPNDGRYRPRQRICWDCYAVALEVINAEQLDSSDEESSSGVKSLPTCLGYVSPRRWASNLQLFPTSPHGSQFGSAWSLTPHSPKSATLRGARQHDKEFSDARMSRDRMNARSATLPPRSMDSKELDAANQSPPSPNEVFTTWSLDTNHNVTCLLDASGDQPSKSHSRFVEGSSVDKDVGERVGHGVWNSTAKDAGDSVDKDVGELIRNDVWDSADKEAGDSDDNDTGEPAEGYDAGDSVDKETGDSVDDDAEKSVGYVAKDSADKEAGYSVDNDVWDSAGNDQGDLVDNDAGDSVDSATNHEKNTKVNLASVVLTKKKQVVDEISDNQSTKTSLTIQIEQRTSGESDVDSSSGQSSTSDWVLVQSSEIENDLQRSCAASSSPMSSAINKSDADDIGLLTERNIAEIDQVTSRHGHVIDNLDGVIDDETIVEDESFRFDPIIAAAPEENFNIDDNESEDIPFDSISEIIDESSKFCDLQSSPPIVTAIDDDVNKQTLSDATNQSSIDEIEDEIPEKHDHTDVTRSALNFDTDDSSSSDDDFGLRPIAEEPFNAINTPPVKTKNAHSSYDRIVETRHDNASFSSDDLDTNIPSEMIDDTHDRTNKKSLSEVCVNGELPPISYMHERRQVKFDQVTAVTQSSMIDNVNDTALQPSALPNDFNEQPQASGSTTKTYLYNHLHGSKDSPANSSASDQECEQAVDNGQAEVSNHLTPSNPTIYDDDTRNAEFQDANSPNEDQNGSQLRRRGKNTRAHSVEVNSASLSEESVPKRPSIRSDGIIANRQTAWKDKKRKTGVTFALPILEVDTPTTERGERKKNPSLQRASTEIVENHRDSRMLDRGASLDNEMLTKPKTLRESRRISNKERLSSLQNPKEARVDEGNKPDQSEDEDVSAILSDIISNVFTTKTLTDWAKSFGEGSMPIIVIAGVSITAAVSLSLIAFLALR